MNMKNMIVAIAIIALPAYGYWLMDHLDRYLYHTKGQLTFTAKVRTACKKRIIRSIKHFASLQQMRHGPGTWRASH